MSFFGNRPVRSSRDRKRSRLRLGLESLEGRQLLTASLLASTVDGSGNAVDFAIRSDASVVANQERPTNNITTPFQYSGYQTLSGLSASSITAFTFPNGDPAVVAMTGPESYLYVDRYTATGNPADPVAWTGWQQFGTFVATSVEAADNATSTAALFAIGADAQVYVAPGDPSTTAATGFASFQPLPGFSAASISVLGTGGGTYDVAALGGPQSYVEGNRVTLSLSGNSVQGAGWKQDGNFVATSVNLTPGFNLTALGTNYNPAGAIFLFAVGTDGGLYNDSLTPNRFSQAPDSTTYTFDSPNKRVVSSSAIVSNGYLTVYALTSSGEILQDQITATGLSSPDSLNDTGWSSLTAAGSPYLFPGFTATTMATTPTRDGGSDLLAIDTKGTIDVSHLPSHAALRFPGYTLNYNSYGGWFDLTTRAYHPIVSDLGPNGLPMVVSLASDGTPEVSIKTSSGSGSNPTPSYTSFAKLGGVAATSVAVSQEPNGFAVFALTGQQSNIFENQYFATGDSANPHAWTGWKQVGTDVATSIAAATPTGASATAGATVFALGVNGVIAASTPTSQSADPTQATFTALDGLAATSFSVKPLGSQVLIAALTNTQSYAYANLYTPPSQGTTTPRPSSWTLTGDFVLSKVVASTTPDGAPVVAGITPNGFRAVSLSLDGSTPPPSSLGNYVVLNSPPMFSTGTGSSYLTAIDFVPLTVNAASAVAYLLLVPSGNNGVYSETITASGPSPINFSTLTGSKVGRSLATSPNDPMNNIFLADALGQVYVSQASASGDPNNPVTYTAFTSIGMV